MTNLQEYLKEQGVNEFTDQKEVAAFTKHFYLTNV